MESLLYRWADALMEGYELDDEERREVRKAVARRWGGFFQENRSKVQPLLNEFIEMRAAVEPPAKQRVQAWARRAAPLFDDLQRQLAQGMDDFRGVLDEGERVEFERDVLGMGAGLQTARQRIEKWSAGDVDVEELWARPRERRARRGAERRKRPRTEAEAPQEALPLERARDQIVLETGAWEKYVGDFIENHGFNEAQRITAVSCLAELRQRALAHRDSYRDEIARLEVRIENNTGTETELAEIKAELVKLYGPIDEMFAELKRRIAAIPTSGQQAVPDTTTPRP